MKAKSLQTGILLLSFLIAVSLSSCGRSKEKKEKDSSESATEKIQLFNGKDLNNWVFYLRDPSVDASKVFMVHNDVIHITGDPFGYMRTKDSWSDYTLNVEWRYPGEASNSGVFIHAQLPDTIWPMSIECQLKAGSAGDFVCMGGSDINERTDKSVRSVKKMAESSEKAAGEWNTMVITCISDNIDVFVNGVHQNKATGSTIKEGHICLQSEGKDIEFRNVYITRLKK
jgi:hypothetical protein